MAGNFVNYGVTGFDSGKDFGKVYSDHLLSAAQQHSSQAHEMVKKLYDTMQQYKFMQMGVNPYDGKVEPNGYQNQQAPLRDAYNRLEQTQSDPRSNQSTFINPNQYNTRPIISPQLQQATPTPEQPAPTYQQDAVPDWYRTWWQQQNPQTPIQYMYQETNLANQRNGRMPYTAPAAPPVPPISNSPVGNIPR